LKKLEVKNPKKNQEVKQDVSENIHEITKSIEKLKVINL
jgi:hypothetical protein